MLRLADPFSSEHRPVLTGRRAAIAAAHPLAVAAGQEIICQGGSAVDAVIAAHAVISVINPDAGGLGGDGFFLIRDPEGGLMGINAAGRSAAASPSVTTDDGSSVAVPGLVAGWADLTARWGCMPLADLLAPAIRIAREGITPGQQLRAALVAQSARLEAGGAELWPVLAGHRAGATRILQPELARSLEIIASDGCSGFYGGLIAHAIVKAVARRGGALDVTDLSDHRSVIAPPVSVDAFGVRISVQPPMSQGILLAMCVKSLAAAEQGRCDPDHAAIETTLAAFEHRARVAEGEALLDASLGFDPHRASGRSGARPYLHTAGVAAADDEGLVVSSLLSVFDDFGSAIYVPEAGFVLNNRAAGFTVAPNEPAGAKFPVHTLAPAIIEMGEDVLALATPGADG